MSPPLTRAAAFANIGLSAAAVIFVGLAGRILLRSDPSADLPSLAVFVGLPVLLAVASVSALALKPALKVGVVLALVSTGAALFVGDAILLLIHPPQTAVQAAQMAHRPFDSRRAVETLNDLRSRGVHAYPNLSAPQLRRLRLRLAGHLVQPLAPAVSSTVTVFCNDPGDWILFQSDSFGFNNPPDLWSAPTLDILLIGDSFTEGVCVRPERHVAAYLRQRWPRTLNLGVAGSGPLFQFAIFREYRHPSPRVVLWMFYEGNDLYDLQAERNDPRLSRYLATDSIQGLAAQQQAIDSVLRAYTDSVLKIPGVVSLVPQYQTGGLDRLVDVLKLVHLRAALGFGIVAPPPRGFLAPFPEILARVKAQVDCSGGHLYFVYLPSYARYDRTIGENVQGRAQVLDLVRRLGIPLIDVVPRFSRAPNPRQLWVYPSGHYNDEGYRVVADLVIETLERDSVLRSSSTPAPRGEACGGGNDPPGGP